uniref:Melanocyte-stimulating hormone receptor-like n=1 Tax=Crassostrea virginica TaxID=6565 RepID=A0A8B8BXE8_CRAVI|nr:melanocyte-stimulating hormone receptor-like [Crassostrea virginica]
MESEDKFVNSSTAGVEFDILPPPLIRDGIQTPTGILITIVNLFSFVALYRCSRLSFQIRILAINLCLSDFLTGTSLIVPHRFFFYNNCAYQKYLPSSFLVVSSFTVSMINLDRCLAIHFGIRYYIYMSRKVLISLCASFWVLSIPLVYLLYFNMETTSGISCIPIFYLDKNSVTITVSAILLAIIVFNLFMFVFLVRNIRMSAGRSPYTKDKRYPEQARVTRKLVVITGCFTVCSLPYIITTFPILDNDHPQFRTIHIAMVIIFMSNSFINPLLYVWRLREARYQAKRLLCCWNRRFIRRLERRNKEDIATYYIYVQHIPQQLKQPSM